jgi:hypothetical protein
MADALTYTAFAGHRLLASGDLTTVLLRVKDHVDRGESESPLVFEDQTGRELDFDLRGTADEVLARLPSHPAFAADEVPEPASRGPGRPRLGVVSREVSLLPRHWRWLAAQPGSASATLRRLVEEARRRDHGATRARQARDAAGKFMWVVAGDLPDFEEASRALYADELDRLQALTDGWPRDVRAHLLRLVDDYRRLVATAGTVPETSPDVDP